MIFSETPNTSKPMFNANSHRTGPTHIFQNTLLICFQVQSVQIEVQGGLWLWTYFHYSLFHFAKFCEHLNTFNCHAHMGDYRLPKPEFGLTRKVGQKLAHCSLVFSYQKLDHVLPFTPPLQMVSHVHSTCPAPVSIWV